MNRRGTTRRSALTTSCWVGFALARKARFATAHWQRWATSTQSPESRHNLPGLQDLHRDPFDEVARDLPAPPIVDLGGGRAGVARKVLDVLERDPLLEQVGDGKNTVGFISSLRT